MKFQDDGLILVSISVSKESKMLEIEVADEGCGVSQKFVEQGLIFKPFSRDESSSFQIGSGLGLSICKKLVENDLGGKSCFWFSCTFFHIKNQGKLDIGQTVLEDRCFGFRYR